MSLSSPRGKEAVYSKREHPATDACHRGVNEDEVATTWSKHGGMPDRVYGGGTGEGYQQQSRRPDEVVKGARTSVRW